MRTKYLQYNLIQTIDLFSNYLLNLDTLKAILYWGRDKWADNFNGLVEYHMRFYLSSAYNLQPEH